MVGVGLNEALSQTMSSRQDLSGFIALQRFDDPVQLSATTRSESG